MGVSLHPLQEIGGGRGLAQIILISGGSGPRILFPPCRFAAVGPPAFEDFISVTLCSLGCTLFHRYVRKIGAGARGFYLSQVKSNYLSQVKSNPPLLTFYHQRIDLSALWNCVSRSYKKN
jgi:hypothetical protein